MRQVPYLIIGNGRVAKHFCHYLQLLQIPHLQWFRKDCPITLESGIEKSERLLLLINDDAIETFITSNQNLLHQKTLIHCSGQLAIPLACSAHPLMTFTKTLYPLEHYQQIPFILEESGPLFQELFPELKNPHFYINASLKPLYHSLCVMSGNFTCLLWDKFFTELEETFQIPKSAAFPYLQQITSNLRNNPESALTGPLVRNDQKTIRRNLEALENDKFSKIYQAFVDVYREKNKK